MPPHFPERGPWPRGDTCSCLTNPLVWRAEGLTGEHPWVSFQWMENRCQGINVGAQSLLGGQSYRQRGYRLVA